MQSTAPKILVLNQFESDIDSDFNMDTIFLGSAEAPSDKEMLEMLVREFSNFENEDGVFYTETWWDETLYSDVVEFLKTFGYTVYHPLTVIFSYQG